ncbi:hypothetical protein R50073_50320 (plasmid) [Maricurvus nonylphenolicus]|uniref:hypothetical protein n=1 Tax=Maricurvus nonylphenolicus TaxID=1008307 RepID=UPI0036F23E71
MSISLHDRMLSAAEQLNLPKQYKSDLDDDPRVLSAFEGCSFIWLLRTCGSTLIPLKVGADPCYVTNWLYGSHGQEVHAFLIDEKHLTVEKINFEEAEKLILSPPEQITALMSFEAVHSTVSSVLESGSERGVWGTFSSPTLDCADWQKWEAYFRNSGNSLMQTFMHKALSRRAASLN